MITILLVGGLPVFPQSRNRGYGPSSMVGVLLVQDDLSTSLTSGPCPEAT